MIRTLLSILLLIGTQCNAMDQSRLPNGEEDRTQIDLQNLIDSSHEMVKQAQEVVKSLEGKQLTQEQQELILQVCTLTDLMNSIGQQALDKEQNSRNS